jgi:hypothetical protein
MCLFKWHDVLNYNLNFVARSYLIFFNLIIVSQAEVKMVTYVYITLTPITST